MKRFLRQYAAGRIPQVGLLVLAALLTAPWTQTQVVAKPEAAPAPNLTLDDTPLRREVKAATSFATVVKKVSPSVVNIYSTLVVKERQLQNQWSNDPFFRHFFGDDSGRPATPRREQSLGSGVIVSPEGYILTASHVVEGAESVKVALSSGEKEFDAKVIGTDPPSDLAVLKIDAKRTLPAVTIADSEKLEVVMWCWRSATRSELGRR